MITVYRLSANELDEQFLESVRALFKGKDLEITVTELDETDYLLRSDANRRRLLQAVENIEHRHGLVEVAEDLLQ
jgi:antitoxin YefM